MHLNGIAKRITALALGAALLTATALPAFAEGTQQINVKYTYNAIDGTTWEKISHADFGTETNDGVVDYLGNGKVGPYVQGASTENNGDRGQSYSYAAETYGDWVYIGTMYGGLGANSILTRGFGNLDPEVTKATIDVMYNGNMYIGEPDGVSAGGILYKFNVKTGETKILMAQSADEGGTGVINILRGSTKIGDKLYFVGMTIDRNTPGLTEQEYQTAIALQSGFPCVYEVDPTQGDKITRIYDCGVEDINDYRKLTSANGATLAEINNWYFTSTRAISTYTNSKNETALIAGGLNADEGAFLAASNNPSAGQDTFTEILGKAEFDSLGVTPACKRGDVNGGGGIYQVLQFNDKLYVVVCVGNEASQNPDNGMKTSFAIVRGELTGTDATKRENWHWSVLAGNTEGEGDAKAKYSYGLDPERVSAGACTLQVYGDYLYIGDYNDVSSALQNMVTKKNFQTLYTNLQQSINLYRMDKNENVEKVVGDPTEAFPTSLTGAGSGYGTHMTQYTWQTAVHEGKMYLSTMDETTLLEPIAQFTNGDLLNMSAEEWRKQINYLRVLLELIAKKSDDSASGVAMFAQNEAATPETATPETATYAAPTTPANRSEALALVNAAVAAANEHAADAVSVYEARTEQDDAATEQPITLTEEQTNELADALVDGEYVLNSLDEDSSALLFNMNGLMADLTDLVDTTEVEEFVEYYGELIDALGDIADQLPPNLKALYELLLQVATKENMIYLVKCLPYLKDSEAGFDLLTFTNNADGSVTMEPVTRTGFGDRYSHGLRVFAETTDYFIIGTASPFYGSQLWRTKNTAVKPEPAPSEKPAATQKPTTVTATAAETTAPVAKTIGVIPQTSDDMPIVPLAVACLGALGAFGVAFALKKRNHQ